MRTGIAGSTARGPRAYVGKWETESNFNFADVSVVTQSVLLLSPNAQPQVMYMSCCFNNEGVASTMDTSWHFSWLEMLHILLRQ